MTCLSHYCDKQVLTKLKRKENLLNVISRTKTNKTNKIILSYRIYAIRKQKKRLWLIAILQ